MRGADLLIPRPEGLYCPPGGFHIDPVRPVARALVTHAHSDHATPGHGAVLATRETLDLMALRLGPDFAGTTEAAPLGRPIALGETTATFHPAGHVLGSAQIAVEHRGLRITAAGDYKRSADPTCAAFEPVPCDIFITEATFGLPVFRHPPPQAEIARLLASLSAFPDRAHLVGVYALGKAQRVIRLLRDAGYDAPIHIHGALRRICDYYAHQGIALGELRDVSAGPAPRRAFAGEIVLAPPSAFGTTWMRRFADPLIGFASGWMQVRARARQRGVELPLVISDHCDWDELTATITGLAPREVWVTHGREEALVRWCALQGLPARPLHLVGYEDEAESMRSFADLLERLAFTPARSGKLRLLTRYLAETPDPDRGWGLAALTGDLALASVKPAMLRALVAERVDAELFALSYDFVGDLAETIALIWPVPTDPAGDPPLAEVVESLRAASRREGPRLVEALLDRLDASGRYALLKLVTGGLRVGVSARLAKQALAGLGARDVTTIEELWHGQSPPYRPLFAWLQGDGPRPVAAGATPFRPVMLAHPVDEAGLAALDPADFAAEWKWDGIRVQAAAEGGRRRLYSRSGDDISAAFPDLLDALDFEGALDGELLVRSPEGDIAPFAELQQRLNRKTVTPAQLRRYPAHLRAYDLLQAGPRDLRPLPFAERRTALDAFAARLDPARFDLSPLLPFASWDDLAALRAAPPDPVIEGVMLKRTDAPYVPGRPKGLWFKWKRDPHLIDAVLMYAQRGHGKRSGFYSDYTFGVWGRDGALLPVGKAYFGFTDEELAEIDRWVRANTTERFGPVRAVRAEPDHGLVFEVAFEGLARSTRHKSGLAMRFPRIARLRRDKPPRDADRLATLEAMLP